MKKEPPALAFRPRIFLFFGDDTKYTKGEGDFLEERGAQKVGSSPLADYSQWGPEPENATRFMPSLVRSRRLVV